MGAPSPRNFKAILRQNLIHNCPVTPSDVDRAEEIYGPDISTLKGKSTRRNHGRVKDDHIEIPRWLVEENSEVELCIDGMEVSGLKFLTSIDTTIRYRGAIYIPSKEHDQYYKAIDKLLRTYNQAGFTITTIHCDREFNEMIDLIKDELDITIIPTSVQEHQPEAERNSRTIKERCRSAFHQLLYKGIPKEMIKYLVLTPT